MLHSETDDCRWLNSRSREAQLIEAVGEQQARKAAAGALTFPLLKGPSAGSPWLQSRLVEVIAICDGRFPRKPADAPARKISVATA